MPASPPRARRPATSRSPPWDSTSRTPGRCSSSRTCSRRTTTSRTSTPTRPSPRKPWPLDLWSFVRGAWFPPRANGPDERRRRPPAGPKPADKDREQTVTSEWPPGPGETGTISILEDLGDRDGQGGREAKKGRRTQDHGQTDDATIREVGTASEAPAVSICGD